MIKIGRLVKMRTFDGGQGVYGLSISKRPLTHEGVRFTRDYNPPKPEFKYSGEIFEVIAVNKHRVMVWVPEHNGYDWFPIDDVYLV